MVGGAIAYKKKNADDQWVAANEGEDGIEQYDDATENMDGTPIAPAVEPDDDEDDDEDEGDEGYESAEEEDEEKKGGVKKKTAVAAEPVADADATVVTKARSGDDGDGDHHEMGGTAVADATDEGREEVVTPDDEPEPLAKPVVTPQSTQPLSIKPYGGGGEEDESGGGGGSSDGDGDGNGKDESLKESGDGERGSGSGNLSDFHFAKVMENLHDQYSPNDDNGVYRNSNGIHDGDGGGGRKSTLDLALSSTNSSSDGGQNQQTKIGDNGYETPDGYGTPAMAVSSHNRNQHNDSDMDGESGDGNGIHDVNGNDNNGSADGSSQMVFSGDMSGDNTDQFNQKIQSQLLEVEHTMNACLDKVDKLNASIEAKRREIQGEGSNDSMFTRAYKRFAGNTRKEPQQGLGAVRNTRKAPLPNSAQINAESEDSPQSNSQGLAAAASPAQSNQPQKSRLFESWRRNNTPSTNNTDSDEFTGVNPLNPPEQNSASTPKTTEKPGFFKTIGSYIGFSSPTSGDQTARTASQADTNPEGAAAIPSDTSDATVFNPMQSNEKKL